VTGLRREIAGGLSELAEILVGEGEYADREAAFPTGSGSVDVQVNPAFSPPHSAVFDVGDLRNGRRRESSRASDGPMDHAERRRRGPERAETNLPTSTSARRTFSAG